MGKFHLHLHFTMPPAHLTPVNGPDLITLELGPRCYGITTVAYERPLEFEPLPTGSSQRDRICGIVRIGDNSSVPVFDLRNHQTGSGRCRLVIASGYHGEHCPVSMAFLIDDTPQPPPRARKHIRSTPAPMSLSRN